MPFTMTMPKLSPTMNEGTITKWLKNEGDYVNSGDLIIEVATDKATVEHTIADPGFLRKILIKEGNEAEVNQPIAIFTEEENENIEDYEPEDLREKKPAKEEEKKEEPKEEAVEKEEAEKKPKKAPEAVMAQPEFIPEPPLEGYVFSYPVEDIQDRTFASPLAKKLAKEHGLDLTTVKGTGPNNRIMSRDLEKAQPLGIVSFGPRTMPTETPGTYEEEALSPMRKAIGNRLQEAKTFIPHIYVQQTVDAEALVMVRDQLKNLGNKITFNDLAVRASALALKEYPKMNSGFDTKNQKVIRFKTIDISVAVSVEGGLITPIIRHADYKTLGEISVEMKSLARKAKAGKLKPEEYKGGSFTVSNLGMYGVTNFMAIINPPQAGIIAISGIREIPVVKEGKVVPGKTMEITLSCDHRVIDGVAAAEFINILKKYLETPAALLI